MRRAARTDANHQQVRDALRARSWDVIDTSRAGDGFPDLVALKPGRLVLIEVKDGSKVPSKQRLTEAEAKLHARFKAAGVPVIVVASVADAEQV